MGILPLLVRLGFALTPLVTSYSFPLKRSGLRFSALAFMLSKTSESEFKYLRRVEIELELESLGGGNDEMN